MSAELVRQIGQDLEALGTSERATNEQAYQKSDWHFLGVTLPNIRATERKLAKTNKVTSRDELLTLFDLLWDEPVWEVRMLAVLQLIRYETLLDKRDLDKVKGLVIECSGWAFNDMFGCHLLGAMVKRDPRFLNVMDTWAKADNIWLRRVAMQSLLFDFRKGDLEQWHRFVAYATPCLGAKDFWTRKVIGWICRETSKRNPKEVSEFLLENRSKLSGLTLREGAKYLPLEIRVELGLA